MFLEVSGVGNLDAGRNWQTDTASNFLFVLLRCLLSRSVINGLETSLSFMVIKEL